MTDKEIKEHIESNCRSADMDEQAYYEGAKWMRNQILKELEECDHLDDLRRSLIS